MLPTLIDFRPKKFGTKTLLLFFFFSQVRLRYCCLGYIHICRHACFSVQIFHHVAIWLQLVIQISPYMQVITHALQRSIEHFLF